MYHCGTGGEVVGGPGCRCGAIGADSVCLGLFNSVLGGKSKKVRAGILFLAGKIKSGGEKK